MDERMTICNMSIEGGARAGYVNPDETTFDYLRGRRFAPQGDDVRARRARGGARMASDPGAPYDDEVEIDAAAIAPDGDLGHQSRAVGLRRRAAAAARPTRRPPTRAGDRRGARVHGLRGRRSRSPARGSTSRSSARARTRGCPICARPRGSSRGQHVAPHVRALVVPGSQAVRAAAEREGLDRVFIEAGFDWRGAGCSMCLAMNPDKLEGREVCASSSNRNFKGRQGSPTGRTLLMSPAMVAAAAVAGEVVDVRDVRRWRLSRSAQIAGTALPLRGDNIDTDRIIPARFLQVDHVRRPRAAPLRGRPPAARGRGARHPFDDPAYAGRGDAARQRELRLRLVARARAAGDPPPRHPRGRRRVVLGDLLRQLGGDRHAVRDGRRARRRRADGSCVEQDPGARVRRRSRARMRRRRRRRDVPDRRCPPAPREAFLDGHWDATGLLLDRYDEVERACAQASARTSLAGA